MNVFHPIRHYATHGKGAVAIWFGFTLPLIVSSVGVSVDLGQSFLVHERLSRSLDAAALAAASYPSEDPQEIEERVNQFIEANYPPDKVGFTTDVTVENHADTLYVNAYARLNTTFSRVVGKEYIDVYAEAEVTKEVKSIEVVLVMDVTGSMNTKTGGKTRIQSLKDASNLFLDTMFDRVKDKKRIKIGLVPFSASVNVGPYGTGKTLTGANYGPSFISPMTKPYFNPNSKTNPSATEKKRWWGCILEGPTPTDTQDHDGPWEQYRYCRNSSEQVKCDATDANANANIGCTKSIVTPMTNNKTDLANSVNAMVAEGSTYINVGLVWGERMISPEFPFEEGAPWNDEDWKKAIVLMTDGVNEPSGYYSAYGLTSTAGITATKLNNRLLDVCDDLKDKNVLLYTITFDKGVNAATKNLFKQCATQPSMWYDAPDSKTLEQVYMTIAKELANLHLSK